MNRGSEKSLPCCFIQPFTKGRHRLGDRDFGTFEPLKRHLVARADASAGDDTAINARSRRCGIALGKCRIAHAGCEGGAGYARRGRFQYDIPDDEAVADIDVPVVEAFDHEVLTEGAGRQRLSERLTPPGQCLQPFEIDRLIHAAMVLAIADRISDNAFGVDQNPASHRRFEDTGFIALAGQFFGLPDADSVKFHGLEVLQSIPFYIHMG